MTVNILKTVKNNFSNKHCRIIRATGVIYRSICRNSYFLLTLKSKKTNSFDYGIRNESLSPKHIKSSGINSNIFQNITNLGN